MILDNWTGSFWAATITTKTPSEGRTATVQTRSLIDFATRTLHLEFDPLQRKILEENPSNTLLLCSRQWGKTFLGAIRALWIASTRPRSTVLVVSRTFKR